MKRPVACSLCLRCIIGPPVPRPPVMLQWERFLQLLNLKNHQEAPWLRLTLRLYRGLVLESELVRWAIHSVISQNVIYRDGSLPMAEIFKSL
jgi:hypothetical protein